MYVFFSTAYSIGRTVLLVQISQQTVKVGKDTIWLNCSQQMKVDIASF